jgi:hypothetical protein
MKNTKNQVPQRRIPRPIGITYLCNQYQKSQTEENKEKIHDTLIYYYLNQGFSFNGKTIPIEQFSQMVGIPISHVTTKMYQVNSKLSNFQDPVHIANIASTLLSLTTNWSIKNHGEILAQVEVMKRAQGGVYRPFISSTLGSILETAIKSNKNMLELFSTFKEKPGIDPLNSLVRMFKNQTDDDKDKGKETVTPEKALNMILDLEREKSEDTKSKELGDNNQALMLKHNIKPLETLSNSSMLELTEPVKEELPPKIEEKMLVPRKKLPISPIKV